MKILRFSGLVLIAVGFISDAHAGIITGAAQFLGDANRPTAVYTGLTFSYPTVWTNYTVGSLADKSPAFNDRTHLWAAPTNSGGTLWNFPSYLSGAEYVMLANDNRNNNPFQVTLTLGSAATVYLLIDNRGGVNDNSGANPPMLGTSTNAAGGPFMQWVLDQGYQAKTTGLNRLGKPGTLNLTIPDEIGIDESANGSIDNYSSIYSKNFPAGIVNFGEFGLDGRNMYGIAVTVIPEPSVAMLGLLSAALLFRRRQARVGR